MVLVDKDIKSRVSSNQLIIKGFKEENLGSVSYDLAIDVFCNGDKTEIELNPFDSIFAKSNEEILIPNNMIGIPAEKNSRMRQGLKVDAPIYQPGHKTFVYMRIQNISGNVIKLRQGDKVLQLFFEQLTDVPELPYDKNPRSSFNNEENFFGLGKYTEEYRNQIINTTKNAERKIEKITDHIYTNVIAILGVFAAIISIIVTNIQALSDHKEFTTILKFDGSIVFCILVLLISLKVFFKK